MLRSVLAAAALTLAGSLVPAGTALAQGLVPCAVEDGYCRVPYPTRVLYGIEGRLTAREVGGGGIACSNDVFGDPAPGRRKRCLYVARGGYGDGYGRPRGGYEEVYGPPRRRYEEPFYEQPVVSRGYAAWRVCSREEGYCQFQGRKRVRYGANGRYFEGVFVNGVPCTNDVFGDPVQGKLKSCQVLE